MAGEGRILAVDALLLLLASLALTFQCCGFLLPFFMLQHLHQRKYIVTRSDPGLASYPGDLQAFPLQNETPDGRVTKSARPGIRLSGLPYLSCKCDTEKT